MSGGWSWPIQWPARDSKDNGAGREKTVRGAGVGSATRPGLAFLAPLVYLFAAPVTLVAALFIWVGSLFGKPVLAYEGVRVWCRTLHLVCGVRHRVIGLEHVPDGPYVVFSNHSSHLDGPGLIAVLPEPQYFVIKRELEQIPVWGGAVRRVGFISIDRSNSMLARETLETAVEVVRQGRRVLFFPEGTRAGDHRLHRFKKGGFHLSVAAGVPILPVAVNGSRRLFPKGALLPRSGEIEIVVGRPITTEGLEAGGIPRLMERTREAILEGRRRDPDFIDDEAPRDR